MRISVIIPSYNDGLEINNTIESLLTNTSIHEIIIVDDFSIKPLLGYINVLDKRIKIIRSKENYGVGRSFDIGASAASGDVLYLMGSDIRFDSQDTVYVMSKCADENPNSIVGCECVGVSDKLEFESVNTKKYQMMQHDMLGKRHRLLGADILWKMTNLDLSDLNLQRIDDTYRDIIQAKWRRNDGEVKALEKVHCVHGATYAIRKDWYDHLKGFESHRIWGGLEPMISIKSWLAGGNCLVMGDVYTGHIFGRGVNRKTDMWAKYFNKVYMAYMFFDDQLTNELVNHVVTTNPPVKAKMEILKNWGNIYRYQREYYESIFTKDIRDTMLFDTWLT